MIIDDVNSSLLAWFPIIAVTEEDRATIMLSQILAGALGKRGVTILGAEGTEYICVSSKLKICYMMKIREKL